MGKTHGIIVCLLFAGLVMSVIAVLSLTEKSKTLADVTSPSGDWRVVVRGRQLLLSGIEVTAAVHTHDGRIHSLGVIDLRQEWAETEFDYQAHETLHTRIDEVKAVVGPMMNHRLLFRDNYFPDQKFAVSGTIEGEPVTMRIGKVDVTKFQFMSGLNTLDRPSVSIGTMDLSRQLVEGQVLTVEENEFVVPGTIYHWHDSRNDQAMNGGHNKNFSMRLELESVTEHVVVGNLELAGKDPQVSLSGRFRLVNTVAGKEGRSMP